MKRLRLTFNIDEYEYKVINDLIKTNAGSIDLKNDKLTFTNEHSSIEEGTYTIHPELTKIEVDKSEFKEVYNCDDYCNLLD